MSHIDHIPLNTPERMLLALLRASLQQTAADPNCFRSATDADWKACFRLATFQGVKALAWDGVVTLPAQLQPYEDLRLTWLVAVDNYEQKYARYCRTVDELSQFYAARGIRTVQLKGVGLSACYPVPSHREGGDLDIYTLSADVSVLSDTDANRLADELMRQSGIEVNLHHYKHSNFYYRGIPVENHKCFLNVKRYPVARRLEALLKECLQPRESMLLEGECRIWVPSPEFNMLFVSFHALQHYGSGLSLHHLCDWAVLLRRYGLLWPEELTDEPFRRFVAAITLLCNRYLGTEVVVTGGETLADAILQEILRSPFPHKAKGPQGSKWEILKYKLRRFRHQGRLAGSVYPVSLFSRVWKSIVYHVLHPSTIFRT